MAVSGKEWVLGLRCGCGERAQASEGLGDFAAFSFDEVEQFFGSSGVFHDFGVRIDGFEVVVLDFDLLASDGGLLADLDIREVVVPDALSGAAFGEEEEVRLDAGAGCGEGTGGKIHHGPEVALHRGRCRSGHRRRDCR